MSRLKIRVERLEKAQTVAGAERTYSFAQLVLSSQLSSGGKDTEEIEELVGPPSQVVVPGEPTPAEVVVNIVKGRRAEGTSV